MASHQHPSNCEKQRTAANGARSPEVQRIIACAVFRPALKQLQRSGLLKRLRFNFLPSYLHLYPHRLKQQLRRRITAAKRRDERVLCFYGNCFPGINAFCDRHDCRRIGAAHCYELLLGSERFQRIIQEETGTYFLEQDLLINFEAYCMEPLELQDAEMRQFFFANYKRLLYVRQPTDSELIERVRELADFLQLRMEIADADYSHLIKEICKFI